jgi:hypothetical protein
MAIVFSSKISDSTNEYTISNYYTGMSPHLQNYKPPSFLSSLHHHYALIILRNLNAHADIQDTRYSGEDSLSDSVISFVEFQLGSQVPQLLWQMLPTLSCLSRS